MYSLLRPVSYVAAVQRPTKVFTSVRSGNAVLKPLKTLVRLRIPMLGHTRVINCVLLRSKNLGIQAQRRPGSLPGLRRGQDALHQHEPSTLF